MTNLVEGIGDPLVGYIATLFDDGIFHAGDGDIGGFGNGDFLVGEDCNVVIIACLSNEEQQRLNGGDPVAFVCFW